MTIEAVIAQIQTKYPETYSKDKTQMLIASFEKMSPIIRKALEAYLQTDQHEQLNILGITVEKLMTENSMNEIAAYLALDWIIREPDQALKSLKKGHDIVEFPTI